MKKKCMKKEEICTEEKEEGKYTEAEDEDEKEEHGGER